ANDNNVMEIYGNAPTNFVIAGNYVGVGVDGTTVFTNGGRYLKFMDFNKVGVLRVGSDFDGVSDAIEGNLISWNHPFRTLYGDPPNPGTVFGGAWAFLTPKVGARVSVRGNQMVNNLLAPFMYADNAGGLLATFTNYEAPFMRVAGPIIPQLSANSTAGDIIGRCALTNGGAFSNILIDVYVLDPEGWNN